jgi:hypothetical protein
MRDPEIVEVVEQILGVGEGESEPAGSTPQLQPICGQYWKYHVLLGLTEHE